MDLETAIEAHSQWKIKLRGAIVKKEQLDSALISGHGNCALGKWLAGEGKMKFGAKPEFQKLVESHKLFHQAAGQVASAVNAGNTSEAEKLLNGPFATQSQQTVGAIRACKKTCS